MRNEQPPKARVHRQLVPRAFPADHPILGDEEGLAGQFRRLGPLLRLQCATDEQKKS
jgi:hypothetical protein